MKSRQFERIYVLASAVTMLLVICGCDDKGLVDQNYQGDPLATVNGSLSIDAPPGGQKISIAVAWLNDSYGEDDVETTPNFVGDEEGEVSCDGIPAPYQSETYRAPGMTLFALQSAAYEATSLVSFQLPILELPPESARTDLADMNVGEGWVAFGVLIAFLDENGDEKFDAATPETSGDTLLAVSVKETGDIEYQGIVVYVNGTFIDDPYVQEFYGDFSQGFNIQVLEYNLATDEETLTTDSHQTVRLFTPDPFVAYEMADLQCSEIEITVDFNESFARDDYGEAMTCWVSQSEMDSSDPTEIVEGSLSLGWNDGAADPNNPCIIRESKGFVCFPGSNISDEWWDFCDIEDPTEFGSSQTDTDSDSSAGEASDITDSGEG